MKKGHPIDQGNGSTNATIDIVLGRYDAGSNTGSTNNSDSTDSTARDGAGDPLNVCLRIQLSNELTLDTGGSLWHAGLAGAQHLLSFPPLLSIVRGKNVLEVGGGCGLFGMAAAIAGARRVVITDIESQMPILQHNIDSNRHLWETNGNDVGCVVECCVHYFGEALPKSDSSKEFDVLIAADVGFDLSLHAPLTQTLTHFLRGNVGTGNQTYGQEGARKDVLLVEEVRWKDIYQWYIQGMTDAFNEYSGVDNLTDDFDENDDSNEAVSKVVTNAMSKSVDSIDLTALRRCHASQEQVEAFAVAPGSERSLMCLHASNCRCSCVVTDLESNQESSVVLTHLRQDCR
jgi:predicted nicotinamide N-methyase